MHTQNRVFDGSHLKVDTTRYGLITLLDINAPAPPRSMPSPDKGVSMLTKCYIPLTICIFFGLPGMVAAGNADAPESIKEQDMVSDLTPYQRDRIPVMQGDTIWSIARVNRPQSVTIEQMVLALYFSNPEAFAAQNISQLKTGSQLIVPPAILFTQIPPGDAKELLGKLRSDATYDTRKILHHLKQFRHTAPLHSGKNTANMPTTNTDAGGTASPPENTLKPIPVIEIHTLQQPAPQETVPAAQQQPQTSATPPPQSSSIQVEQNTALPHSGQQGIEKTIAAPPASTTEVAVPAVMPVEQTLPPLTPCTTEDCRLAAEKRLLAIQGELSQLSAMLALQQPHPSVTAGNETAGEIPKGEVAAPIATPNALSKIGTSIKSLDPVVLLIIAGVGILFENAIRALFRFVTSLRKPIAPTSVIDEKPQTQPELSNQTFPVEPPPPGKFEPVVLSSADELGELTSHFSMPEEEYVSVTDTSDWQAIAADKKLGAYDKFEDISPVIPETVIAAKPRPPSQEKTAPRASSENNGSGDDDFGLDFSFHDENKQRSRNDKNL
jgi:FimV-like protein